MRLIDADALIRTMRADPLYFVVERYNIEGPIHAAPTIDAIPVIRCRDCKHFLQIKDTQFGRCKIHYERTQGRRMTRETHYCSWAERKEE